MNFQDIPIPAIKHANSSKILILGVKKFQLAYASDFEEHSIKRAHLSSPYFEYIFKTKRIGNALFLPEENPTKQDFSQRINVGGKYCTVRGSIYGGMHFLTFLNHADDSVCAYVENTPDSRSFYLPTLCFMQDLCFINPYNEDVVPNSPHTLPHIEGSAKTLFIPSPRLLSYLSVEGRCISDRLLNIYQPVWKDLLGISQMEFFGGLDE